MPPLDAGLNVPVLDRVEEVLRPVVHVFGLVVVEPGLAANLDDGQDLSPENADGQLAARDERFDHAIAEFSQHLPGGGHGLFAAIDHVDADAAALPDGLDHEALAQSLQLLLQLRRPHVASELHHRRHVDTGAGKQSLARHLVKRQPAGFGAAARIDQAAILEDLLKLAILAKLAVQGQEEDVDVPPVEDLHVVGPNIRHDHVQPGPLHRLGDAPAALQTHFALAPDARPATPLPVSALQRAICRTF